MDKFEFASDEAPEQQQEAVETSTDKGEAVAAPDYSQEIESLRRENARLQEVNQKYSAELPEFKNELQRLRDEQRQRDLLLLGDKDVIAERQEKLRQDKVRDELFKVVPEFKDFLNRPQQTGPSIAESAFFNSARNTGFELADKAGFKDQAGKEFMVYASDMLIKYNPAWNQRFYQNGDMSVLNEVSDFINKQILEPRDKAIEQRVLSKIRSQNKVAAPLPARGGGSPKVGNGPEKINPTNMDDRRKIYDYLYNKQASDLGE